jgi:hypothetical protein
MYIYKEVFRCHGGTTKSSQIWPFKMTSNKNDTNDGHDQDDQNDNNDDNDNNDYDFNGNSHIYNTKCNMQYIYMSYSKSCIWWYMYQGFGW